jgi:hypothetical protein
MVARWVVAAAAATGCVPVPDRPSDAALLTVNAAAGQVASTGSAPIQFSLSFAASGVRMPESLFLDGVDRVAPGTCPTEAGIGIGVYPAFNASSPMRGGDEATSTLVFDWEGPTIAKARVTWNRSYQCVGRNQDASGTSTFTIFPNGRIVRHDAATPSTTQLSVDSNPCGCASDTSFYFTAYWSFTLTQNVAADGSPLMDGAPSGCAVYPNHMIGVAWPDTDVRILSGNGSSAFVHDWASGALTLPPNQREVTSAIILSEQTAPTSCGDVLADLDDFPIMVSGVSVSTDDSGVYADDRRHTDPAVISTPRRLPRGFAISLRVGDYGEVTRSPELGGAWYATQRDGDRTLFWFRDGLGVGETISIDPL